MHRNYEKFEINLELKSDEFRLWKNGQNEAICALETYKEKRSIFVSVCNLRPSSELYGEGKGTYHVVLLGEEDDHLLHRDFGTFHVGQNGEGSFFQKFDGPELSCYTHVLLLADYGRGRDPEVVYQGTTPFFAEETVPSVWQQRLEWCRTQTPTKVFSAEVDETNADWYRVPGEMELPDSLAGAKPLIEAYHHYILGRRGNVWYVGVPGRFLQREQPCRQEGLFLLWQPLRGGENFFDGVETMTERQQEEIFGYWIAGVDVASGRLKPL